MYLWSDYFGELGRAGERLTQHAPWRGREVYLYPAGTGDLREAIEAIRADAAERGNPMRLRSLTNETREELEALYPGKFEFTACRNSYDYIYTVEELSELHGKKLQSKRNHCHRFESEHPDWHCVCSPRALTTAFLWTPSAPAKSPSSAKRQPPSTSTATPWKCPKTSISGSSPTD